MAKRNLFKRIRHNPTTPQDQVRYTIPLGIIEKTQMVLLDYANLESPHEGLVYWGGRRLGNIVEVQAMIAPATTSHSGRVSTNNRANVDLVRTLTDNSQVYIAQVHSHPGSWVDHSDGDTEWAAFKFEGLLSIVVPIYCTRGMLPLTKCGVHRYQRETFIRLSNTYIVSHFQISNKSEAQYWDFRDE
jgi:proteasome lid subunit RPN8/RPN11